MNSGQLGLRRFRFDPPVLSGPLSGPHLTNADPTERRECVSAERLDSAISRTRDYLLSAQYREAYWVGELAGDSILESEYIRLVEGMGGGICEAVRVASNYLIKKKHPGGGRSSYPGGTLERGGSGKSYFALEMTGHSPDAEYMRRARAALLAAGEAERVNSF